jgi:hypothetical protein
MILFVIGLCKTVYRFCCAKDLEQRERMSSEIDEPIIVNENPVDFDRIEVPD